MSGRVWTDERDAELERELASGKSLGQIARDMGVPKNAVIGRWQRIKARKVREAQAMMGYVMKPIKHSPRKKGAKGAAARENALARTATEPMPKPLLRSRIQDEWPLTLCAELPLRIDLEYEPVN